MLATLFRGKKVGLRGVILKTCLCVVAFMTVSRNVAQEPSQKVQEIYAHKGDVNSLCLIDSDRLAIIHSNGDLAMVNCRTKAIEWKLRLEGLGSEPSVILNGPKMTSTLLCISENVVVTFDYNTKKVTSVKKMPVDGVTSAKLLASNMLLVGTIKGTVHELDLKKGKEIWSVSPKVPRDFLYTTSVDCSPDGKNVSATYHNDGDSGQDQLVIWGKEKKNIVFDYAHEVQVIRRATFDPSRPNKLLTTKDSAFCVVDLSQKKVELRVLLKFSQPCKDLALSRDGKITVVSLSHSVVKISERASSEVFGTKTWLDGIHLVAISPDGTTIVVSYYDASSRNHKIVAIR